MPRRFALLLVLLLLVAACTADGGAASTTSDDSSGATTTENSTTETPETGVTTTTAVATTPVTEPDLSGVEGLSSEARTQLESLIRAAQEIRGLPFLSPPIITVVSDAELEARVRAEFAEESDGFPADDALYKLLGLLSPDADLEVLLTDLYGDQVAGFYDGEVGEIVVPVKEDGFSILQQGTMVHELVHALTDQHFGFDTSFREMIDQERFDEAGGYQALIEGDATLAEVLWLQTLSQAQLGQFFAESLQIDSSTLDAAPLFIQDALIFPYDTGLVFTQELHAQGGWQAVNEAYIDFPDLPASTEQVITPDDFRRDLPTSVPLPNIELAGYELVYTSVWGEEGFRSMLSQVVGDNTASKAADGWGGDSYYQWFDGENAAMLLIYEGDTDRDLEELRSALLNYARTAVPVEDFVWVDEEGGLLYFIAADDPVVGQMLRDEAGLES